jgi:hypothetical protein
VGTKGGSKESNFRVDHFLLEFFCSPSNYCCWTPLGTYISVTTTRLWSKVNSCPTMQALQDTSLRIFHDKSWVMSTLWLLIDSYKILIRLGYICISKLHLVCVLHFSKMFLLVGRNMLKNHFSGGNMGCLEIVLTWTYFDFRHTTDFLTAIYYLHSIWISSTISAYVSTLPKLPSASNPWIIFGVNIGPKSLCLLRTLGVKLSVCERQWKCLDETLAFQMFEGFHFLGFCGRV